MGRDGSISGLLARVLKIALRNPAALHTAFRLEYRHRLGIPRDRRHRPGYSAPPTNLAICLTMRCNLECIMCRQNRHLREIPANRSWFREDLPLAPWLSLLDQVQSFHPWLYITGGEPTIYPHFREMVEGAKKRHLLVQVQTNGTLLARQADFLVETGVEAATISLDGTPEVHDQVRGVPGTFRQVAEGVEALVAARRRLNRPNPILSFNFTVTKANLAALPEMVPLALRLGADALQIQHSMFNSPEKVTRHNRWFTEAHVAKLGLDMALPSVNEDEYYRSELGQKDIPALVAGLQEAQRQANGRLFLTTLPNLPPELVGPYYLDLDYPFAQGCNMFWKTFRVLSDGTVSPCLNFKVGNISRQSFQEIWNGPQMAQLRRLFAQCLFPGCARCCQRHYLAGSRAF